MADFPLLNEASLVMIPGATKEGKVYSQLPTDGSGDFTFTRSTSATRVNKAGNIEKGYENLLYPSNDFSGWAKVELDLTPNQADPFGGNTASLITTTGTTFGFIRQQPTNTGVQTISFYAKAGSNTIFTATIINSPYPQVKFTLTGDGSVSSNSVPIDSTITSVGDGWYRCSMTYNITSSYEIRFYPNDIINETIGDSAYIYGFQLNQGLVAYPYLETTTAPVYGGLQADQPRLDYTDATCPSLLLEPSRTNRIPHSEYYNSFLNYGTGNSVFTSNVATSPENVENAYKIILNSGKTGGGGAVSSWAGAFTQGESITFSIFLKADEFDEVQLGGYFQNENATFNLRDGSVVSQASNVTNAYSVPFGNDWYRCVVTYTFQNGIGNNFLYSGYKVFAKSNGVSLIGDGVKGVLAYGAQFEQGSYPTSYIPTYGSFGSRGADNAVNTNTIDADNDFTLLIESKSISSASSPKFLDGIGYLNVNGSGNLRYRYNSNNYSQTGDYTQTFKWLLRKDSTSMKIYLNGVLRRTITSGIISGSRDINFEGGMTTNFMTFPKALTDTECIALTTL